jgi:hypothetical protein
MEFDAGEATMVSTLRPSEALVPGLPAPMPDGLNGDVACVRACLAAGGTDVPTPELMGISGAAFRAYFYRRADNPGHESEPDWCWTSEIFSSRDACGTIAEYCGASIERKLELEPEAAWALVELETAQGRPVVSYGVGGPLEPVIITGYRRGARRVLRVQSKFLAARDAEVDVTGKANWAGEGAPLTNPVVLVRTRAAPAPDQARRTTFRLEACRWAVEHARARTEVLATGKRYAAGVRAFEAFADFLGGADGAASALANDWEKEELPLFVAVMAAEWRRARQAAAIFLESWAFEIWELGPHAARPAGGVPALRRAAGAYREVAEALAGFEAELPPPWEDQARADAALADATRRGRAAGILREAATAEARAAQCLEAVLAGPAG